MRWQQRNPGAHADYNKAWRQANPTTRANWAARNIPFIRYRAKKAGIPFDISEADVYVPECCPIFGTALVFGGARGNPHSPSIDRIKPELGYVKGNVAVISARANTLKNNATPAELRQVADWLAKQVQ